MSTPNISIAIENVCGALKDQATRSLAGEKLTTEIEARMSKFNYVSWDLEIIVMTLYGHEASMMQRFAQLQSHRDLIAWR